VRSDDRSEEAEDYRGVDPSGGRRTAPEEPRAHQTPRRRLRCRP